MHILSVSGPVVTAAGHGDQLAIVSHASDCLPSGDQVVISMFIWLSALDGDIDICCYKKFCMVLSSIPVLFILHL